MRLYGTTKPAAPFRMLKAGQLEVRLERGNLRYVTFAGQEVLRAIAYVVRDRDWGTYEPALEKLTVEETPDRFRVSYEGSCRSAEAQLRYHAEVEGHADGGLRFAVIAEPDGDFLTNRCGFTVLHPIESVAGAPLTVEHVDGSMEESFFPELIEPWQPFREIRALTHVAGGRFRATCRLEGAPFEMEDHRNWSDASFKTYVRPLELPWPYTMKARQADRQSVSLSIKQSGAEGRSGGVVSRNGSRSITITVLPPHTSPRRHPEIGLAMGPDEVDDTLANLESLEDVAPQVILCHFDPTAGHCHHALSAFAKLQKHHPARYILECVVAADGDVGEEMASVADGIRRADLDLSAIAVCPSVDRQSTPPGSAWPPCPPLEEVYAAARGAFPSIPIGGGMFSYFTELNRKRPPVELLDFVTHCTNPIVHAADDESVMETLESLPHITHSARTIIGNATPYHIGPSTIAMRQNPYGSRSFANPLGDRICMAETDPRHFGLFGAAWTIGYAAGIAEGAPALYVPTAFVGPRGLLARQADGDGWLRYPVFHAVRLLARMAGGTVFPCEASEPKRAAALAAETGAGRIVLVANLTAEPFEFALSGPFAGILSTAETLDAVCGGWRTKKGPSPRRSDKKGGRLALDAFGLTILTG